MSQQINLINPALIKKKDFLTVVNIGVMYGVFSLVLLAWYVLSAQQLSTLTRTQQGLADELQQAQASLAQLVASRAPRTPNPALQQQLVFLENKQHMQAQMLDAIEQGKPQQGRGLANYMRGFAKQTIVGLWLTGFSIDETNKTMTVRGRTLEAEVLPTYMQKLGHEPVFSGKSFGGLRIKQADNASTATTNSQAQATAVNGAATSPSAREATSQLFVEFELQGLEKLSPTTEDTSLAVEVKS
jgi:Tfp pilus assembly protein PilN